MIFYKFEVDDQKKCITIQSKVKYDTLDIINAESPLIKSNVFKIARGKRWYDLIQFDDSSNFAISRKVKKLLEDNNITGWGCFPIIIEGVNVEYYAFQNLSKAGPIENLEAVINYEAENIIFDIKTWNGSEIFHLRDTLLNVCTQPVKDMLEDSKITNLKIRPL